MSNDKKEIFDFLLKAEKKLEIDWKASILNLVKLAENCTKILIDLSILAECRRVEKEDKDKRLPAFAMQDKVTEIGIRATKEQRLANADTFYRPVRLRNIATNEKFYFSDEMVVLLLKKMLSDNFNIPDDMPNLINYASALKGAFYSLLNMEKSIPMQVILKLNGILIDIAHKAKDLQNDSLQKEANIDRGRKSNRSDITQRNFEKLKNHLQPGMREKEIRQKIHDILGAKDGKTKEKYLDMWKKYEASGLLIPDHGNKGGYS